MNATPQQKQTEPLLVPAAAVARVLSCTSRYVLILADQGTIPVHRIGKRLIRFELAAVLSAIGVKSPTEAAAIAGAQQ
jgi:excisionase family DNA binding protein